MLGWRVVWIELINGLILLYFRLVLLGGASRLRRVGRRDWRGRLRILLTMLIKLQRDLRYWDCKMRKQICIVSCRDVL